MSFVNQAPIDFTLPLERARLHDALVAFRTSPSPTIYPIISGIEILGGEQYKRFDPASPDTLVGTSYFANLQDLELALSNAHKFQVSWSNTPWQDRIKLTRNLAALMRDQRFALAALIIREAGKPWKEADADVVEAIDFCEYYAYQAETLATPKLTAHVLGEVNYYSYHARGVAAVISPWNFPLAITCGMTIAALITGNVVILKPAEQTSLIAGELVRLIYQAGFPSESISFLPGRGETIGSRLVRDTRVHLVCFTGSKTVGLDIIKACAEVPAEQAHIKRVIAELGGKNAIIVDEDADLDEAVKGVLYSAFGYAGQKCSACSRVVALRSCYRTLLARLSEAAGDLIIGKPEDSSTFVGPLIDAESQKRVLELINTYSQDLNLALKTDFAKQGHFVPVTIFRDVPTDSALWREEVFAPVLAVRSADNFAHALELVNDSQYGLTAAVYSRSPNNIQLAKQRLQVGNLYINRPSTGAIVCRQPFGGLKLSGIGSKAGGPDYLQQFVEPRLTSENTMRRGFTPEE